MRLPYLILTYPLHRTYSLIVYHTIVESDEVLVNNAFKSMYKRLSNQTLQGHTEVFIMIKPVETRTKLEDVSCDSDFLSRVSFISMRIRVFES